MLEALDRTLRDIMMKPEKPFGDKIVILAGDFRQCLPVVPGATRAGTVSHCINQSPLWTNFQMLRLTQNMRVFASGDPALEEFDAWTLSLGNGDTDKVKIPRDMIAVSITPNSIENNMAESQAMKDFIVKIFPNLVTNIYDKKWLDGRAILCSTNKEVFMVNEMMSTMLPGTQVSYVSADELVNTEDLLRFNAEYLNNLTPNGLASSQTRHAPYVIEEYQSQGRSV